MLPDYPVSDKKDSKSDPFLFWFLISIVINVGCDGLRHKTKYVRLKDFTELDLISDYRVLENATSAVDKYDIT